MDTLTLSHLPTQLLNLPSWEQVIDTSLTWLEAFFARKEAKQQARDYVQALLSPVERKNGWQLAEHLGHANPYRLQHLLDRAVWDADAVREELRSYVVEHLGSPEGVAVIDESGLLKKGTHSCGVKPQYSGAAGGVANCQVGVFLGYASEHGHTLLDRELYLPQEWAEDTERRDKAKVPATVEFLTKPQLAQKMLERAFVANVPIAWVTADTIYGGDRPLRQSLEHRHQPYVLAVAWDARLPWEQGAIRARTLADRVPPSGWQTLSCDLGAKGPRVYDWARVALDAPEQVGFARWLLVRRSLSDPTQRAYYLVFAPEDTPLSTLVAVAGTRWTIEVCLEHGKSEVGLDQ